VSHKIISRKHAGIIFAAGVVSFVFFIRKLYSCITNVLSSMNIGSVEPHGSSALIAPHADGELFVDRSIALRRDKSKEEDDIKEGGLLGGAKLVSTSLGEAISTEKSVIDTAKPTPSSPKTEKTTRRKKKWRKPKDKPNRPLSAYNLFFARERSLMLGVDAPTAEQEALKKRVHCKTHGKIGFAVMARTIGSKWKALEPKRKKVFEDMAKKEKDRYQMELGVWKATRMSKKIDNGEVSSKEASSVLIPMNASAMLAGRVAPYNPLQMQDMPLHSDGKHQSDSLRLLFESRMHRRNSSHLQTPTQAGFIRNMQGFPMDHAAVLRMSQRQMMFDVSSQGQALRQQQQQQGQNQDQQYPNAAEASASTLLNHFQPGIPGTSCQIQVNPLPQQTNLMDQQLFQEFAAMRRMQQSFMAGGHGMTGVGGMNVMSGMNMSLNSAGMNPFGINNTNNINGIGGINNRSMLGGNMNMNNFGNGM
jgi:hypothetical protein